MPEKKLACGKSITLGGELRMKEMRAWTQAEREGDLEACYKYLARLVVAWDFDLPIVPESFDELMMAEYQQINQAVAAYLRDELGAKN